nr:protein ZINC INDUCED FACILITATOR-LIKE 1-like [Hydra vulgaris]
MKIGTMMKNIVCSEGSTPLPIGICLLMFIIVLFNDLTMTSVFSYLPRLVKEFGISEVDVGKKTGIISSSMFIAKIFSSSIWGYFCDKWGRKLSLLMSAGGVVLSTLMFGFSFNYNWAVMARFFQGCFMESLRVIKMHTVLEGETIGLNLIPGKKLCTTCRSKVMTFLSKCISKNKNDEDLDIVNERSIQNKKESVDTHFACN